MIVTGATISLCKVVWSNSLGTIIATSFKYWHCFGFAFLLHWNNVVFVDFFYLMRKMSYNMGQYFSCSNNTPDPAYINTRTLRGVAAQKYALQFSFILKNWTTKSSGGIFVKLVDCGGCLVNLASTEYRSITEKFKEFFIKLMDFRIILTKSRFFLQNSRSTTRLLKVQGFFCKVRLHKVRGIFH